MCLYQSKLSVVLIILIGMQAVVLTISSEVLKTEHGKTGKIINRQKRFVQLSENQIDVPEASCTLPDGTSGQCRRLQQCMREEYKSNIMLFADQLCVFNKTSIGACCPDDFARDGIAALAGDLPATAPREEENEAFLKITKAENRGCGLSTRAHGRLVGARPANAREWPWMVSVTPTGYAQYCGGVLITDRHVLTAAHCFKRLTAEDLEVRLGEYDMSRTNDTRSYDFKVTELRIHEFYDSTNYLNDIAILKLDRPAVFNSYVWPICLPPLGQQLTNKTAVVVGWGTEFFGGPNSDVLMEVSIPIWDTEQCRNTLANTVFDENLCAGGYEGGMDSCQGDSGGPLMYQLPSGRWTVVGIVSWGIRCGEINHPGVYVRVDKYLKWIVQNAVF